MDRLKLTAIWDGMTALVLADLSRLFFMAAPFTLLPSVAIQLFVPPLPSLPADITAQQWLWVIVVPFVLGNFAQLAVTALLLLPEITPRAGFAAAMALWPAYLALLLILALPIGVGTLLLLVPGLYLYARLAFLASTVLVAEGGLPLAVIRRSWDLTAPVQWPLLLFLIAALFGVVGILMLFSSAGSALDVVARAVSLDAVGRFALALSGGLASTIVAIAGAAASVFVYRAIERR